MLKKAKGREVRLDYVRYILVESYGGLLVQIFLIEATGRAE